jgi:ABC-type glycerol-3-phosphate transport system permease component
MNKRALRQAPALTALAILLFLALVPLGLMLVISGKDGVQYQANPTGLSLPFHFANYARAFAFMAPNFAWTFVVIALGIGLNLLTSSLAAYAFARHRFPGKAFLRLFITGLMFVPSVLVIFPLYLWNVRLGLRDVLEIGRAHV